MSTSQLNSHDDFYSDNDNDDIYNDNEGDDDDNDDGVNDLRLC